MDSSHIRGNVSFQFAPEQSDSLQSGDTYNDGTNCSGISNIEPLFHEGVSKQPMQPQGLQNLQDGHNNMSTSSSIQRFLHLCRFCHRKEYPTPKLLLEHEFTCPMHCLQLQQEHQLLLLQSAAHQQAQQAAAQQFQMQQHRNQFDLLDELQHRRLQTDAKQNLNFDLDNKMQRQIQIQHDQMKQFDLQQNQLNLSNSMSMIGTNGQLMPASTSRFGNVSENNNLQAQRFQKQGFIYLPEHQTGCGTWNQVQVQQEAGQSLSKADRVDVAKHQYQSQELKPLSFSSADSSKHHFPLALPEDEEWLTPLHCFVRRYCAEAFVATHEDVAAPCMGKRKHVSVNQVGIRCQYCSSAHTASIGQGDTAKAGSENGIVYPSLISRIYNSSINLLQRHFSGCPRVPPEILSRYKELKCSGSRSGASKKYWALSAQKLGLIDTPDGIRLDKDVHAAHVAAQVENLAANARWGKDKTGRAPSMLLVLPSDKRDTTAFTFHVMSQLQPCVFTEADRLGRRRDHKVGFHGLACRHCNGEHCCSGRFFPGTLKTMTDATKTLDSAFRHILSCKYCPWNIKSGIKTLKDFHDIERSKLSFGSHRAFFVKIWCRLHQIDLLPSSITHVPAKTENTATVSLLRLNATGRRRGEICDEQKVKEVHLNKIVTEAA
ncbi:hypothetical protein ACHAXA_003888 [Cyclostephanos tholiformis]|uniref:Uncharacterized protein n=1 Tax=Cyclostephanos tholiformis TaxID=382380 RepID=A0ABD3R8W6_9STRA